MLFSYIRPVVFNMGFGGRKDILNILITMIMTVYLQIYIPKILV